MFNILSRITTGLAALGLCLTTGTMAQAQNGYRPGDERVVCIDDFASANLYSDLGTTVQDQLLNGTTMQVRDFGFGPNDVTYFQVNVPGTDGAADQTGYISTNDVKNFCDFERRRRIMLEQYQAPPNTCHLIGASRRTLEEVNSFRDENLRFFPSMSVYQSNNGWYAISLGLVRLDMADQIIANNNDVPDDAYCADGGNYIGVLEKRSDSFAQIDIPLFASLADRFAAARTMRLEAEDTKDGPLYKRACDLGDWIACARYSNTIRDTTENTDPDIIQRNHYDLLGCMRGSHFGCNNAFNQRRSFVDHVLSSQRLRSDEGRPKIAEELARVGCDGDVWPSCRHLGEQTWDRDANIPGSFPLALQARHAACVLNGNLYDDLCVYFSRELNFKSYADAAPFEAYDQYEVALVNANSCSHNATTEWSDCADAYRAYGKFLAANVGTDDMKGAAYNFLIDGCEIGDTDACVAFGRGTRYMPEYVSAFSDIYRKDRLAFVCNDQSDFTNMRNLPTSDGSFIMARLPNDVLVNVLENVVNDAGYLYQKVRLQNVRAGAVLATEGYIYHAALSERCDINEVITQPMQDLALDLARVNELMIARDSYQLNANFDGSELLLTNLPGLRDITPLDDLTGLAFLDLSRANVVDLTPLTNSTSLETLSLYYTDVVDAAPLAGLTQLRVLNLRGTDVTDLSPLANLTSLEVFYPPRGDTDLTPIQPLIDAGLRVE